MMSENPNFDVKPGTAEGIYLVSQLLTAVDLVKDRRTGSKELSRTRFTGHPIFEGEVTTVGSYYKDGENWFSVRTHLYLADLYKFRDHQGYFDFAKVQKINDLLNSRTNMVIEARHNPNDNYIKIEGDNFGLIVEFGFDSTLAERSWYEKMESDLEQLKDLASELSKKFERYQKEMGWTNEITPEEQEFQEAWKEVAARSTAGYVRDYKNHEVLIELTTKTDDRLDDDFLRELLSVRLRDKEMLRGALQFFADGYREVVKTICEVEEVEEPKETVILGSAIFN